MDEANGLPSTLTLVVQRQNRPYPLSETFVVSVSVGVSVRVWARVMARLTVRDSVCERGFAELPWSEGWGRLCA